MHEGLQFLIGLISGILAWFLCIGLSHLFYWLSIVVIPTIINAVDTQTKLESGDFWINFDDTAIDQFYFITFFLAPVMTVIQAVWFILMLLYAITYLPLKAMMPKMNGFGLLNLMLGLKNAPSKGDKK